ncbi:hypothetical protein BB559_005082 [Furculomyces boomerangus]|uniref:Uncharacterized protein n=2 Tax=Harpellales TaxID=61421 RepID=A0A2T9YAX5_9FUNG|nr:hypothetical protein BB559_005082 [Furculomyces boomerangus]PWA00201.1 hypothetical protein BB558_003757 [Smittium angustum]
MAIGEFRIEHNDLIHDIEYNYYGNRMATCSSDKRIKVYDWDEETDSWLLNDFWRAHDSSVLSICWCHPEYGQIIASCSLDRTVKIWVEQPNQIKNSGLRWMLAATLTESLASVHSISFGPEYLGLMLGAASSDGEVRIYSPNESINIQSWSVSSQIDAFAGGAKDSNGPMCISWCRSRFIPYQMMAVGCSKTKSIQVFCLVKNQWAFGFNVAKLSEEVTSVSWAPQMGRPYHIICCGSTDGIVRIYYVWIKYREPVSTESLFYRDINGEIKQRGMESFEEEEFDSEGFGVGFNNEEHKGGQSSDGNKGFNPPTSGNNVLGDGQETKISSQAVSVGNRANSGGSFGQQGLKSKSSLGNEVVNSGVNVDINVASSNTGSVKMSSYPIGYSSDDGVGGVQTILGTGFGESVRVELVAELDNHGKMPIRRVKWNATGSLFVSCGDDGTTKLWQKDLNDKWVCKGQIS